MIRNIIFDMGEVLIHFDRPFFLQRLGLQPEEETLLMRQVFQSLEWARMDRGSMTDLEAAQSICQRVPAHLHEAVHKLVGMWDRPILPVEGMYELVKELKEKGYRLLLLSNASIRQHEYWPRIPAHVFFDGKLISADVKLVKPQPEIYRLLCETFDVRPEECFFVDDSIQNIEGAFCCGIAGAVFHQDVSELRAIMCAHGIDVAEG